MAPADGVLLDEAPAHGQQRERQAAISRLRENAAFVRAQSLPVDEGWALSYLSYITGLLSTSRRDLADTKPRCDPSALSLHQAGRVPA